MGLILAVVVHSAGIQDRDGAEAVLDPIKRENPERLKTRLGRQRLFGQADRVGQTRLWFLVGDREAKRRRQGIQAAAPLLGRAAHLRMAEKVSADEQGL